MAESYLFDFARSPSETPLTIPSMPYTTSYSNSYPTYSTTYFPSTSTSTPSIPTTATTARAASIGSASPPSWFLPGPRPTQINKPGKPDERRAPPHGPSGTSEPTTGTASNVGGTAGRPARRVQRSGVGQSRHSPCASSSSSSSSSKGSSTSTSTLEIRCWDHGCEGRKFSSLGNYRRHLREKNGQAKVHPCPDCGRVFTRSTARNFHRESGTCGLSPKQLMLQMNMNMNMNMAMQMGSGSGSGIASGIGMGMQAPVVPPVNVPSAPYCGSLGWNPDLYPNVVPGVFLLGS
ncbi:hypothetical protein BDV18DRAFT_155236 [Aspergillus unguis]